MNRMARLVTFALTAVVLILGVGTTAHAGREPVLAQVDLPHDYYWRGLYLPQLTSGPSSADFMPDSETLVYSMQGSLWRQHIGNAKAEEITHATGAYDYQPDVSPDGRSVVFARYDGSAIELWLLDFSTGNVRQLTHGGAVNVEPRISPDGTRLAWVSTRGTGHFDLYVADLGADGLQNVRMLLGEHQSRVERYYYSQIDHVINPSWSSDGGTIYYVTNRGVVLGTGDIWAVNVDHPERRHRVLSEETTWSADPQQAPHGNRILYSSYHGRQHHQLWLTTTAGAAPLPLTFGNFDRRHARWSPDGTRIVYVDNRDGYTSLRVMQVVGGKTITIKPERRDYKLPQTHVQIKILNEVGHSVPARVSILANDDRAYAPLHAWVYASDGFDRSLKSVETHYFHCFSSCQVNVPAGTVSIRVQHGFRHKVWRRDLRLTPGGHKQLTVHLEPQSLPPAFGHFTSADLHIHMNYGGPYLNTPKHLVKQARAEDLDVAFNLVVNKEERVPDIAWFRTSPYPASTDKTLLLPGQEYHSSYWGHMGLLHLTDHYLTPGFTAYRNTAMASAYPTNAVVADLAHAQRALVGYAHPFDVLPDPAHDASLSNELPADVINGKVDYLEVMGFSNHKATAKVWYRLLNLGFRLPAGAGSDTMANYASLHGPVGLERVFLDTGGELTPSAVYTALKSGRGFVSNGPLLGLLIDGKRPSDQIAAGRHHFRVALRSFVAIDHLELVQNGEVVKRFNLGRDRHSFDFSGELNFAGGWVLLRAWNDNASPEVLDQYPYATTNPVWVGDHVLAPTASADAAWFAHWIARCIESAASRDDYNTIEERRKTLHYLKQARQSYLRLAPEQAPNTIRGDVQ